MKVFETKCNICIKTGALFVYLFKFRFLSIDKSLLSYSFSPWWLNLLKKLFVFVDFNVCKYMYDLCRILECFFLFIYVLSETVRLCMYKMSNIFIKKMAKHSVPDIWSASKSNIRMKGGENKVHKLCYFDSIIIVFEVFHFRLLFAFPIAGMKIEIWFFRMIAKLCFLGIFAEITLLYKFFSLHFYRFWNVNLQ